MFLDGLCTKLRTHCYRSYLVGRDYAQSYALIVIGLTSLDETMHTVAHSLLSVLPCNTRLRTKLRTHCYRSYLVRRDYAQSYALIVISLTLNERCEFTEESSVHPEFVHNGADRGWNTEHGDGEVSQCKVDKEVEVSFRGFISGH